METSIDCESLNSIFEHLNVNFVEVQKCNNGVVNSTYFIDDISGEKYVLRLCSPQYNRFKTLNEIAVMDFVRRNCSIPIPEVIEYDSTVSNALGAEYMLMRRLPGVPLVEIIKDLPLDQLKSITLQIIGYLSQIWRYKFPLIGGFDEQMKQTLLVDGEIGPFENLASYFIADLDLKIQKLIEKNDLTYVEPLMRYRDRILPTCTDRVPFVLTHMDMNYSNVLIGSDGMVTGLLDWEWAMTAPIEQEVVNSRLYENKQLKEFFIAECSKAAGVDIADCIARRGDHYIVSNCAMVLSRYHEWNIKPEEEAAFLKEITDPLDEVLRKHSCL